MNFLRSAVLQFCSFALLHFCVIFASFPFSLPFPSPFLPITSISHLCSQYVPQGLVQIRSSTEEFPTRWKCSIRLNGSIHPCTKDSFLPQPVVLAFPPPSPVLAALSSHYKNAPQHKNHIEIEIDGIISLSFSKI